MKQHSAAEPQPTNHESEELAKDPKQRDAAALSLSKCLQSLDW